MLHKTAMVCVQPQIGDSLYTTTAKHTLQYISVPLRLGYQLNKNKWSITPTVGIALNVLKNASIETSIENGSQSEQEVPPFNTLFEPVLLYL
ncbi:hypothetical protein T4C_8648 [Trichinella pseudospiralis]|uniref:Uncharacterized protein n=1 Tax=Trichinella pseudospiralis TaxID=6337 RepID=A0A0V1GNH1_TRIPS|nr:hypothetical protein T4C_8648 [Trichinella pseudospiralis]